MPANFNNLISPETTILETLKVIDETALEIALVVKKDRKLLGTVTDGDIRRALINGMTLQTPVKKLMNAHPIVADLETTDDELLFTMTNKSIKHLPIVDKSGKIFRLVLLKDLIALKTRNNYAFIMAGGLGTRLGELTRHRPKPLLPIGGQPIIHIIAEQLRRHGFKKIFVSVNYKAEMIIDYFKNNAPEGLEIEFLQEKEGFLGTAGPLGLIKNDLNNSLVVINGDILSQVNYSNLLEYHLQARKAMTVCTREFSFEIPYGVVKLNGDQLTDIEEKPRQSIFINAGIYVIEPELLKLIPSNRKFDMPELIKMASKTGPGVCCYPISEFWLDIGNPQDYNKARKSFETFSQ
jgi:dTDP-glucose pyrophosphorylase